MTVAYSSFAFSSVLRIVNLFFVGTVTVVKLVLQAGDMFKGEELERVDRVVVKEELDMVEGEMDTVEEEVVILQLSDILTKAR